MSDLISRQAAIDAPERFIKDCNPEHFVGHQKFIEYIDNAEIGSFGNWQFANGFNMGLTATEVAIKELPSAQPEPSQDCVDREYLIEHLTNCFQNGRTMHSPDLTEVLIMIEDIPSAQPEQTLYGYPIEHLEMIARVMSKEHCTPEDVVRLLRNTGEIAKMVRDEMMEMLKESVERFCKGEEL